MPEEISEAVLDVKISLSTKMILEGLGHKMGLNAAATAALVLEGSIAGLVVNPVKRIVGCGMPAEPAAAVAEKEPCVAKAAAAVAKKAAEVPVLQSAESFTESVIGIAAVKEQAAPAVEDDEPLEGLDFGEVKAASKKPAKEQPAPVKTTVIPPVDDSGDTDNLDGLDLSDCELDLSLPYTAPPQAEEVAVPIKTPGKRGRKPKAK